jgi:2-alkyl-3-oxoalkanoate reductase
MRVFVAGASGAIGRPVVADLIRQGNTVTGMKHSDAGAQVLAGLGAIVVKVNAMDTSALADCGKSLSNLEFLCFHDSIVS